MSIASLKLKRVALTASDAADSSSARDAAAVAKQVPFRGPREPRGRESAAFEGRLPDWLRGDLVRSAPLLNASAKWSPAHWFDGLGLMFGIGVDAQQANLRWALLDCEVSRAALRGRVPFSHFASPNQRGRLAQLLGPVPAQTDNTNVNVQRMGDELVAMTETPHQLVLDPLTLEVRSRVHYRDALGSAAMLAHPIINGDTVTNLATQLGRDASVSLYTHAGRSRERTVRATWKTPELPYIHSFGLTERTGIIIAHPFSVRPFQMLWSNRGFIEHFSWKHGAPTRLITLNLQDGSSREHETDPLFCFHTVHAFETADATVLDLLAYDDASIVTALAVDSLADGLPDLSPSLVRLSIDRRSGKVERSSLSDLTFEFPQVDWDHVGAGSEQFVYGSALKNRGGLSSEIVRLDLAHGTSRSFSEAGWIFGEPVFVGAPGRRTEGDGVLLAVASSERGAALFVLDATNLDVLARARFAEALPLGFHGSFANAPRA